MSGETSTLTSLLRLSVNITPGTATYGSTGDYAHDPVTAAFIDISAGSRSGSYDVVNLTTVGDNIAELNETVAFTVSDVPGWTITGAEMTITDDDAVLALEVDTDSVAPNAQSVIRENAGGSGAGFTVTGSFPNAGTSAINTNTVVTLSVEEKASPAAGEAGVDDFDYAPSTPNQLTFAAGATAAATATLSGLSITDDDFVEGTETLTVIGTSHLPSAEFTLTVVYRRAVFLGERGRGDGPGDDGRFVQRGAGRVGGAGGGRRPGGQMVCSPPDRRRTAVGRGRYRKPVGAVPRRRQPDRRYGQPGTVAGAGEISDGRDRRPV